jgi:hypothetical protein
MQIALSYNQPAAPEGQKAYTDSELTLDDLQYLVKTKFPDGLPENQLRVWAGIKSKKKYGCTRNPYSGN